MQPPNPFILPLKEMGRGRDLRPRDLRSVGATLEMIEVGEPLFVHECGIVDCLDFGEIFDAARVAVQAIFDSPRINVDGKQRSGVSKCGSQSQR